MATTSTTSTTLTPFTLTADNYSFTETAFLAALEPPTSTTAPSTIIQLNVTANDGLKNAQVYSVDDGVGSADDLKTTDLLLNSNVTFWSQHLLSAQGNELRIVNGKVQLDIAHSLSLLGLTDVRQMTSGQVITDSFTYAVKNAITGQLAWTTVNFSLSGEGAAANTVAVIMGTVTAGVDASNFSSTGGNVYVIDPDPGQAGFKPVDPLALQGHYGKFTFSAVTGDWTYTVDSALPAVQALAGAWFDGVAYHPGVTANDSFKVTSLDGSASALIGVTLFGANDNATINGQASGQDTTTIVDNGGSLEAAGRLTVVDPDSGQSSLRVPAGAVALPLNPASPSALPQYTLALAHGKLQLTPSTGDWHYIANAAEIVALHGDESLVDKVTLQSLDGTASRDLVFQLQGVDNAATLSGTFQGVYTEGAGRSFFPTGKVLVTDPDHDQAVLRLPDGAFKVSGTGTSAPADLYGVKLPHGTLILSPSTGLWQYIPSEKALDYLHAGESTEDRLMLTSLDGSAQQELVIALQGSDDPATLSGTYTGSVVEDGIASAAGQLGVSDPDHDQSLFAAPLGGALVKGSTYVIKAPYGHFYFNQADGQWSFELDNGSTAVQSLGEGQTGTSSFEVSSIDGSATQAVEVTVTGVNDLAKFSGTTDLKIQADAKDPVDGVVAVQDADADESAFQMPADTALQGQYGAFTFKSLGSEGTWTYAVDASNPTVVALNGGRDGAPPDTLTETLQVLSADGKSTLTLTATIVGVDERPPVPLDPLNLGKVTEDVPSDTLRAELPAGFLPLGSAPLTWTTTYGTFTAEWIDDGKGGVRPFALYDFQASSPAVQPLAEGMRVQDTVNLVGPGGQLLPLTVDVIGANDLATVMGPAGTVSVTEGVNTAVDGTLRVNDVDQGEAGLHLVGSDTSYQTFSGEIIQLGSFQFDPVKSYWSYAIDDAYQAALTSADHAKQTLTLESTDGQTTYTLVVRVDGADSPATAITGTLDGDVTEDGVTRAKGTVAVVDPDLSQRSFVHGSLQGHYGDFSFDDKTGAWSYALRNGDSNVQALAAGKVVTDQLAISSFDGFVGSTIVVSIHGASEPPQIVGDLGGQVTEDDADPAHGTLLVKLDLSGTDASTFQPVSDQPGTWGHFSLDAKGAWTYALDQTAAVQALTEADAFVDAFTVSTADGGATQTVKIEVHGSNDAARIEGISGDVPPFSVQEDGLVQEVGGLFRVVDADAGQSALVATAYGDFAGSYGAFHLSQEGPAGDLVRWSYTLDNQAAQRLDAQSSVDETFRLVAQDGTQLATLVVTVNGQDDMPSLSGDLSGTVVEDASNDEVSGHLTLRDPEGRFTDLSAAATAYGGLRLERSGDGWDWTYHLDNSLYEVNRLTGAPGESPLIETIGLFDSGDGSTPNPVEIAALTVVIQGHDDPTVATPSEVATTEDDLGQYIVGKFLGGEALFKLAGSGGVDPGTGNIVDLTQVRGGWDYGIWSPTVLGGQIAFVDTDTQAPFLAQTQVRGSGGYGYFTVSADGQWTWASDGPHDEFDGGKTYTDTLTVHTVSGETTTVSVAIAGVNDLSEFGIEQKSVTQGSSAADLHVDGTIAVSDPDTPADFIPQYKVQGVAGWGAFTVETNGAWSFDANSAMQGLQAGQWTMDYRYVYNEDQDYGLVSVLIVGVDDPTLVAPTEVSLAEGDSAADLHSTGTLTWEDADFLPLPGSGAVYGALGSPDPITFQAGTIHGLYGDLTVAEDGAWTYQGDGPHDEMVGGQMYEDSFTVNTSNGAAGSLVVRIAGSDDLPTLVPATITVKETAANDWLTVLDLSSLADPDGGPALSFLPVNPAGAGWVLDNGTPGAETVQTGLNWGEFRLANGAWTYLPNVSTLHLSATATLTDTLLVHTQDGQEALLTVVIQGEDNEPTELLPPVQVGFTEDSAGQVPLTGSVLATPDLDTANPIVAAIDKGLYGKFLVEGSGDWTYYPNAALVDPLHPGDVVTDTFSVQSLDGQTTSVTITITGVDDPLLKFNQGASISLFEGNSAADLSASGQLAFTDPDNANPFVATTQVGSWGTFTLSATGAWTFTSDSAHDELKPGQLVYDLFETHLRPDLMVADGVSRDGLFKVVITGTVEAPQYGTSGNDTVRGTAGDDHLYGGDGDDVLLGGDGNDVLQGGPGYDTLSGGAGDDRLKGTMDNAEVTDADRASGDTFIDGLGKNILDGSDSTGPNTFFTTQAASADDTNLLLFGTGSNTAWLGLGSDTIRINAGTTPSTFNSVEHFDLAHDKVALPAGAFPLGDGVGALLMHITSDGYGLYYSNGTTETLLLDLVGLPLPETYDFQLYNVTVPAHAASA